jgi:hypothetical protein
MQQVQSLLHLATQISEEGNSTPETAFLDALALEKIHLYAMLERFEKHPISQSLHSFGA